MESANSIVVIGASAGGLEALLEFVGELGPSCKSAMVIAQHLSPQNPSMLSALISRQTTLDVTNISGITQLMPGTIYINPPDYDVVFEKDCINIVKFEDRAGPKPSINKLFQTLSISAEKYSKNKYIAAIFSGTGSDGSLNLGALRTAGVTVVIQDPETAKYNGMPFSAIQKNEFDAIITAKKFGETINEGNFSNLLLDRDSTIIQSAPVYKDIIDVLLRETGTDFSEYKISTMERRIQRRIAETNAKTLQDYRSIIINDRHEAVNLKNDLLIPVSDFFRDFEAFEALKNHLVNYIVSQNNPSSLRIWVAGCSTGQEAYSIAFLLQEIGEEYSVKFDYSIFASDLDETALEIARSGEYTEQQVKGVSNSYLTKYFEPANGVFKVKSDIRKLVNFAVHDLGRDAPYSRIDLVSCRNLLIYYNPVKQEKFVRLFRYALNRDGLLFIGQSETVPDIGAFEELDKKGKVYRRSNANNFNFGVPIQNSMSTQVKRSEKSASVPVAEKLMSIEAMIPVLDQMYGKSYLLIKRNYELAYVAEKCSEFFDLKTGFVGRNLFDYFEEQVSQSIIAAISTKRAKSRIINVIPVNISVSSSDQLQKYYLQSFAMFENDQDIQYIVVFYESSSLSNAEETQDSSFQEEIYFLKESLHIAVEKLENVNFAFQTATEELQSSNEELQSSNEELQTTNEELQSTNEELLTVNDEMLAKSAILSISQQTLTSVRDTLEDDVIILNDQGEVIFGKSSGIALDNPLGSLDGLKFTDLRWKVNIGKLAEIVLGQKRIKDDGNLMLSNNIQCKIREVELSNSTSPGLSLIIKKI